MKKTPKATSGAKPETMKVSPTSANTPSGAKRMIHMVIMMVTSCTASQKLCKVSRALPVSRDMK